MSALTVSAIIFLSTLGGIFLGALYGQEARPIREEMRSTVGPFADRLWREKETGTTGPFETDGEAERVYLEIQKLSPHDAVQHSLQARAVQISNDLAQVRFLLFAEFESSDPVFGSSGILAGHHIRKLQPVLASQRDGLRLPVAVCFFIGVRNFPDFGTEPAVYRTAAVIQRATTKRPRNDMRTMEPSMTNNPDALLPSAKEVRQKIALAEAEEAEQQARIAAEAQAEKKALSDHLGKPVGHFRGGGDQARDQDHRARDEESDDRG